MIKLDIKPFSLEVSKEFDQVRNIWNSLNTNPSLKEENLMVIVIF